jgi:hypothetical protein
VAPKSSSGKYLIGGLYFLDLALTVRTRSPAHTQARQGYLQVVLDMLSAVSSTIMYVMQQCGPTSFIVKEDATDKQHHVTIGSLQQCSCQKRAQGIAPELCRHIIFVMIKVLKVPSENPLCWQLSLVGEGPSREPPTVLGCE